MKTLFKYIPTHILLFTIIGIVIAATVKVLIPNFVMYVIIAVLLPLLYYNRIFKIAFVLIFILFGMCLYQSKSFENVIVSPSENTVVEVIDIRKPTGFYYNYVGFVYDATNDLKFKVLLRVQRDSTVKPLTIGDCVATKRLPQKIAKSKNPYQFNFSNYLIRKNIFYQVSLQNGTWVKLDDYHSSLKRKAFFTQKKILHNLQKSITDKEVFALAAALLLGEKEYLDKATKENFARAGVVHILAISGLHVGVLLMFFNIAFKIFDRLKYGKFIKVLLILVLLWGYAFIVGLSASVIRAVTMFSFVAVGLWFDNRKNIFHALSTSALVLILYDPFYVFDLGFQMSYLAVLSILVIQPLVYKLWQPENRLWRLVWGTVTVSFAAQLGLLPLSLFYFHQFPLLFLLANLVVLPLMSILLIVGVLMLFFAYFDFEILLLIQLFEFLANQLYWFVNKISNQDFSVIANIHFSGMGFVLLYLFIITAVLFLYKQSFGKMVLLLSVFLCLQGSIIYQKKVQIQITELVIYNQYKATAMSVIEGASVRFYGVGDDHNLVANFKNYVSQTSVETHTTMPNYFKFKAQTIYRLDQAACYKNLAIKPTVLWVSENPNINMERCVKALKPQIVLADGSNYPSLKKRWRQTCISLGIPFWDTTIDGAFVVH